MFITLFFLSSTQVDFLFEPNKCCSHDIITTCSATQNKILHISFFFLIYHRIYSMEQPKGIPFPSYKTRGVIHPDRLGSGIIWKPKWISTMAPKKNRQLKTVKVLNHLFQFFLQVYWDTVGISHCISLRCTLCWLDTFIYIVNRLPPWSWLTPPSCHIISISFL